MVRLNAWQISTLVVGLFFVLSVLTGGFRITGMFAKEMPKEEATKKALDFINEVLLKGEATATLEDVTEETYNVYKLKLNIQGQELNSFITKDGRIFFPNAYEIEKIKEQINSQTLQETQPTKSFQDIGEEGTFSIADTNICKENGKPIIRLFSTTWCPHCKWIKDKFDEVALEYIKQGKIVAYHWEVDTNDNTLTDKVETEVPSSEEAIYKQFNPEGTIPTFVFGCKYYRVGNGYEGQDNGLELEETEFRKIIEKLISS